MAFALPERKKLIAVLKQLFNDVPALRTFLRDNVGKNLPDIVNDNLSNSISRVVDDADSWEWLPELVSTLKDDAPPQARATLETIDLTGSYALPKVDQFRAAVKQSIPTAEILALLQERLNLQVNAGTIDAALAQAQANFLTLAKAVRGEALSHAELRRPLEELGLLARTPDNLEKIVKDANSFLNLRVWLERLTEIEGHVCRVAWDTANGLKAAGSGFLVGPSVVLTNHHVVAAALIGPNDPKTLRVQFDYRMLKDGSVDPGTIVQLDHASAESWRLDFARHSAVDTQVHPIAKDPEPDALDYALLRLAEPIGARPIGPAAAGGTATKRGWIDLHAHAPKAAPKTAVVIVQHPSGLPVQLALDTEAVIGYSPKELRIRYSTNTLAGSSGSPVFDQNLEILALHHCGDPKYPQLSTGRYNEGIPIPALLRQFEQRGMLAKLAE
jgi:hypothetical protein